MDDPLASVQNGYDRWSHVYDHDANPLPALEEPIVRRIAGQIRGLKVLDLGCGTGRHALWMGDAGASVTAVDFSPSMIEQAKRKPGADSIEFIIHDLHRSLPFQESAFDMVVSGLVLEHLRDPAAFFSEIHRVLKPSSGAVISAMHPAMFLRDSRARFTDPRTGQVVQPGSIDHPYSTIVMAALNAPFTIESLSEHAPDARFAEAFPRAVKYVGWPMLIVMSLRKA